MKIHLKGLRFFAFHGLYASEAKTGNHFLVNLTLDCSVADSVLHIEQTVNYAEVYQYLKTEMEVPTPLLETLVQRISAGILARFSLVTAVTISIDKEAPPIPAFNGQSVGVEWKAERKK